MCEVVVVALIEEMRSTKRVTPSSSGRDIFVGKAGGWVSYCSYLHASCLLKREAT